MAYLEKLDGYLPNITHLQHIFVDRRKKLVYCHKFMYQHDRLKHAFEKCNAVMKVRIPLRKEVEEQMSRYVYQLKFQGEDNSVRRKIEVLVEAENLIQEHLDVEDLSLVKIGHPIIHPR